MAYFYLNNKLRRHYTVKMDCNNFGFIGNFCGPPKSGLVHPSQLRRGEQRQILENQFCQGVAVSLNRLKMD